jgi:hypothetical protein
MLSLFKNLFGRRSHRFGGLGFGRRHNTFAQSMNRHRGGIGLGTLAAVAAPLLVRKLRSRRAMHAQGAAY